MIPTPVTWEIQWSSFFPTYLRIYIMRGHSTAGKTIMRDIWLLIWIWISSLRMYPTNWTHCDTCSYGSNTSHNIEIKYQSNTSSYQHKCPLKRLICPSRFLITPFISLLNELQYTADFLYFNSTSQKHCHERDAIIRYFTYNNSGCIQIKCRGATFVV